MLRALVIVLAYLLGSIPFGYLIVKLKRGVDVRETGSGGTGATNVTRRAGKWAGLLTLLLDTLKGAAVALTARLILGEGVDASWWVAAASVAVVAGHIFPVWLKFRGGKGVATGLGVFLILAPSAVLCASIVFVIIVLLTRYVSLGSMAAAAVVPLAVWLLRDRAGANEFILPLMTAASIGGALIIFMHRANIARLLSGTENRLK